MIFSLKLQPILESSNFGLLSTKPDTKTIQAILIRICLNIVESTMLREYCTTPIMFHESVEMVLAVGMAIVMMNDHEMCWACRD